MAARNQNVQIRTPRRRKVWLESHGFYDVSTNANLTVKVLDNALSAMGFVQANGLTVMRTVGSISLCHGSVNAAAAEWEWVRCGLGWVSQAIADASTGDAQWPEPLQDGLRENRWIQQWILGAFSKTSGTTGAFEQANATGTPELAFKEVDVRQQSKQPNLDSVLVFRMNGTTAWTATSMWMRIDLSFLVALP